MSKVPSAFRCHPSYTGWTFWPLVYTWAAASAAAPITASINSSPYQVWRPELVTTNLPELRVLSGPCFRHCRASGLDLLGKLSVGERVPTDMGQRHVVA